MVLERPGLAPLELEQPTLIFHPRACSHRLVAADHGEPVDVLCASIEFGATVGNPLLREIPDTLIVPLRHVRTIFETFLRLGSLVATLAELERRYVQFILSETGGNKSRAAELLGIDRRTIYRYLELNASEDASSPTIE